MVSSYKQLFPLSIFLISHFLLAQSQADRNFCIARPKDCYPISMPVCAYPTNCKDFSCTRTAGNACFACQDPSIASYTLGSCPPYIPQDNQQPQPQPQEPSDFPDEGESEIDVNEQINSCSDVGVAIQVGGDFVEGSFCCAELPVVCPTVYQPVCAILYDCIGSTCQLTKRNACDACHDPNVQLYIPGDCSKLFGQDWITSTEVDSTNNVPIWTTWEEVKLIGEEEYVNFEGEGQFENSDDFKIWVYWHQRG